MWKVDGNQFSDDSSSFQSHWFASEVCPAYPSYWIYLVFWKKLAIKNVWLVGLDQIEYRDYRL